MSKNEMDQQLRARFDAWEVPLNEEPWDDLLAALHVPVAKPKRTINKRFVRVVAALLIFGLAWSAVLYNYMDKQVQKPAQSSRAILSNANDSDPLANAVPTVPANQPISAMTTNFPVANAYSRYLNRPFNIPDQRALVTLTVEPEVIKVAQTDKENNSKSSNKLRMYDEKSSAAKKELVSLHSPSTTTYNEVMTAKMPRPKTHSAFRLDVVGALGYGGQTNGYSIGVQSRFRLSEKVFVDNMLAFGGSRQAYQLQQFQAPMANHFVAAAKGSAVPMQNLKLSGNIYYVTLAPSLGVSITPLLSISVGGDVQKIVNNQVRTPDNFYSNYIADYKGTMILSQPVKWKSWDAGLTAKASVRVTKKLDVGLQYRQGMVNLLAEQEGMMLKRAYGSISLQYRILGSRDLKD